MSYPVEVAKLKALEKKGEYEALIKELRTMIKADKRVLTANYVKQWCGKRWRNLFISAAVEDKEAVKVASKRGLLGRKDKRPDRQKIAERFLKGDEIAEWSIEMPAAQIARKKNVTLVFCPGFINGLLPVQAFPEEFPALVKEEGWKIIRADSHPMRGCDANNADLLRAINLGEGAAANTNLINAGKGKPPKDIILMGYSKGGPDILSLLAHHPEIRPRVRCVFTWAGAIGGAHAADAIYDMIKDMDLNMVVGQLNAFLKLISPAIVTEGKLRRFDEYDIKDGVRSLTTTARGDFLREHKQSIDDANIPIFCVTTATTLMEVPTFQMQDALNLNKYDANNDMQLTQAQAKLDIPMATHLAMLHGHHWDISYPPFPIGRRLGSPNLDHPFPRKAAIQAIFRFSSELGLMD